MFFSKTLKRGVLKVEKTEEEEITLVKKGKVETKVEAKPEDSGKKIPKI